MQIHKHRKRFFIFFDISILIANELIKRKTQNITFKILKTHQILFLT